MQPDSESSESQATFGATMPRHGAESTPFPSVWKPAIVDNLLKYTCTRLGVYVVSKYILYLNDQYEHL